MIVDMSVDREGKNLREEMEVEKEVAERFSVGKVLMRHFLTFNSFKFKLNFMLNCNTQLGQGCLS